MSAPLSISFYVPPPTPTPLPPMRPAFLTAAAAQEKGIDVLSLLSAPAPHQRRASSSEAVHEEAEAALRNAACSAAELKEVLEAVQRKTQMHCFRALLLDDRTTLHLQLEGGLRYIVALHGTAPSPNAVPLLSSKGWRSTSRSPSASPERARAGDSGVAFGGEAQSSKGEAPLSWALFEPTQAPRGRGRALLRNT